MRPHNENGALFMKILIAEDQEGLARPIKIMLEKNGFSVDIARDGVEAIGLLHSNEYDGVLLDVMMPHMTGWEVLAQLREDGNQVPVMMLTAMDSMDDKVRGLENGANDYLTKPFDMRELVARIRAMTRTQTVETSNTLAMGDLTLRRSSCELISASGSFRLGTKEYLMAEMLAHANGNAISVDRFVEKMWPHDTIETPKIMVELYISYLRNKMQALHSKMTITETASGFAIIKGTAEKTFTETWLENATIDDSAGGSEQ